MNYVTYFLSLLLLVITTNCADLQMEHVTVTAYSSTIEETDSTPFIAAWGDSVGAGTIAISRDLLTELSRGQRVLLFLNGHSSAPDTFVVNDKMNRRWKKRVDIWFENKQAAYRFGKKKEVLLLWSNTSIPEKIIIK